MKARLVTLAIISVVVCIAFPAYAEEAEDSTRSEAPVSRIGLGVSLVHNIITSEQNEYVFAPLGLNGISQIYLSIDGGPVRLEPEFAYVRSASENGNTESSIAAMRIGVGLFVVSRLGESTRSYIGVRAAVVRTKSTSKYSSTNREEKKTDIYIGPSIGGEYLLGEHFTLGIEAGFDYGSIGNFDEDSDRKTSLMSTRTQIIVRFYP